MCYSCPPPHYTLYFDDHSGNKDLAGNKKFKYIYRIDFMGNAYVPPCLSDTVEKAKECAAQHVLDQIGKILMLCVLPLPVMLFHMCSFVGTWLRTKLNVYAKQPMPGLVNTMPTKTMPTAANLNAPLFTPINHKVKLYPVIFFAYSFLHGTRFLFKRYYLKCQKDLLIPIWEVVVKMARFLNYIIYLKTDYVYNLYPQYNL